MTDHPDGLKPKSNIGKVTKGDVIRVVAWAAITVASVFSYTLFIYITN